MERIYQMKVVPDVLPSIRPSLDLHLVTPPVTKSGQLAFALENIEPGVYLVPKQVRSLYTRITPERLIELSIDQESTQTIRQRLPYGYKTLYFAVGRSRFVRTLFCSVHMAIDPFL